MRALIGLVISAGFAALTLSRVDLDLMRRAWADVALPLVAAAAVLATVEVGIRAVRWRLLLRALADPGYAATLGYLAIGHVANALLPARLGDVARALITGSRMKISRASVLGTIAVERVADATLLGVVATIGIFVGYATLIGGVTVFALAGLGSAVALGLLFMALGRGLVARTRVGALLGGYIRRFVAGAASLRDPARALKVVALTTTSFALTTSVMHAVGSAAGVPIQPWQSAIVVAGATLATAIPAGPASIGTYEFAGTSIMAAMGFAPEAALIAVGLTHALVVFIPALIGLIAMWLMGISPLGSWLGTSGERREPGPIA